MFYVIREEFRTAATTLGFKPATLRQWRRRRAIPAAAKFRLVYFFNDNFEILEAPPPIPANFQLNVGWLTAREKFSVVALPREHSGDALAPHLLNRVEDAQLIIDHYIPLPDKDARPRQVPAPYEHR